MTQPKRPLDRLLNLFAEVRHGEGGPALLMVLGISLVLTAYYILKPVRDALIIVEGGAAVKAYASAGLALISVGVVAFYNWLYNRSTDRSRLVRQIFVGFAALLVPFAILIMLGDRGEAVIPVAIPFFFYAGMFGAFVIAVFWSYANDIYDNEQGKRLFPLIANGQTVGAVAGAALVAQFAESVSTWMLLIIAGVVLLGGMFAVLRAGVLVGAHSDAATPASTDDKGAAEPPTERTSFFKLMSERYILYIALLILMLNWVNSTGEFLIDRLLEEEAAAAAATAGPEAGANFERVFITQWKGAFFGLVNLTAALMQAFVVSRFIKYLGVRVAILALPTVAFFGAVTLAIVPLLMVIRITKTAENATDYSLQNTTQQALWLVTSPEAKYKAKAAIDTIVKRAGDVASAGTVALGATLALSTRDFVLVNVGLCVAWLVVAVALAREHRKRSDMLDAKRQQNKEAAA